MSHATPRTWATWGVYRRSFPFPNASSLRLRWHITIFGGDTWPYLMVTHDAEARDQITDYQIRRIRSPFSLYTGFVVRALNQNKQIRPTNNLFIPFSSQTKSCLSFCLLWVCVSLTTVLSSLALSVCLSVCHFLYLSLCLALSLYVFLFLSASLSV